MRAEWHDCHSCSKTARPQVVAAATQVSSMQHKASARAACACASRLQSMADLLPAQESDAQGTCRLGAARTSPEMGKQQMSLYNYSMAAVHMHEAPAQQSEVCHTLISICKGFQQQLFCRLRCPHRVSPEAVVSAQQHRQCASGIPTRTIQRADQS